MTTSFVRNLIAFLLSLAGLLLLCPSVSAFELIEKKGEHYYYRTDEGRLISRQIPRHAKGLIQVHADRKNRRRYYQAPDGRIAVAEQVATLLDGTPDYNWYYGCAPTVAGMLLGYYDRNGFQQRRFDNLIPGGEAEISTFWPGEYLANQAIASSEHIADYYVAYEQQANDPNPGGHRDNCLADYMETSKDTAGNADGATSFFYWTDGSAFTWQDVETYNLQSQSGLYGIGEWIRRQGYDFSTLNNQYIDSQAAAGFRFVDYQAQIDSGKPVIIHLSGHAVLGYGYRLPDKLLIYDTFSEGGGALPWGGTYNSSGQTFEHYGVSLLTLAGGAEPDGRYPLYFPHSVNTADWETDIQLLNLSTSQPADIALSALDDAGQQIGDPLLLQLAAGQQQLISVAQQFRQAFAIRQLVAWSNRPELRAVLRFSKTGHYSAALPAISQAGSGNLYLSHIASDSNWWTGIALVNTSATAKDLRLRFNDGNSATLTLPAHGQRAFSIRSLFNEQAQPQIHSALVENSAGVVGLQLFGSTQQLAGLPLTDQTSTVLSVAHSDNRPPGWTGIALYNPTTANDRLTLRPYNVAGAALPVRELNLPARSNIVSLTSALGLPQETAWFDIESHQGCGGLILHGTNDSELLAGYQLVSPPQNQGTLLLADLTADWTGLAFANRSALATELHLIARDSQGRVLAQSRHSLAGHQNLVQLATELFSDNLSGASRIDYSCDRPVSAFCLSATADNSCSSALPGL